MKIKNVKIDLHTGYANSPSIEVHVDDFFQGELGYVEEDCLYFAYDYSTGYVSFFAYDGPGNGYGGHHFEITMMDGTEKTLIGPWSSRAGVMNAAGFQPSVDVTYINKHGSRMAGHILVDTLRDLGLHLVPTQKFGDDDVTYKIKL